MSFDGERYHGWQVQPNGTSVQEELERKLSMLLRETVQVTGAGRTDAGVHALLMVAHFDTEQPIDCQQLAYRLNRVLPDDIAVADIRAVPQEMHARFSALARTYYYYIHQQKDVFRRRTSWEVHYALDFSLMNRACALLLQATDFAAFCKSKSDAKTTRCTVTRAQWVEVGDGCWRFEITANRFLRNMVRAVVGTLLEVGRGRMTIDEFQRVIEGRRRTEAGESVPACGLFLVAIAY